MLDEIRKQARERHEKARAAAAKRGRKDFPAHPVECSWAYEQSFFRFIRSLPPNPHDFFISKRWKEALRGRRDAGRALR